MTNPITPPPELVEQWEAETAHTTKDEIWHVAVQAAQWGADQELEGCIDVLGGQWEWDVLSQCTGWKEFRDQSEEIIRAARRPKPPSLKEQALEGLTRLVSTGEFFSNQMKDLDTIRRALEALND